MKIKIFTIAAVLFMAACNKKEVNTKPIEAAAPEAADFMNGKSCYSYKTAQDTIELSLSVNSNNATGELTYILDGKDKNTGTFSGTFIGDTLFADYSFKSEGRESIREIAFIKKGDVLAEGYGPVEQLDEKTEFKDLKQLKFDGKIKLTKTQCAK